MDEQASPIEKEGRSCDWGAGGAAHHQAAPAGMTPAAFARRGGGGAGSGAWSSAAALLVASLAVLVVQPLWAYGALARVFPRLVWASRPPRPWWRSARRQPGSDHAESWPRSPTRAPPSS
jgi:hypothetical protein